MNDVAWDLRDHDVQPYAGEGRYCRYDGMTLLATVAYVGHSRESGRRGELPVLICPDFVNSIHPSRHDVWIDV